MAKISDLESAIKERAELIGLSNEHIKKLLNREYSHLSVGRWRDKTERTKKEGLRLQAYLEGKKVGLKLTTREELFRPMRELVKLYKAYKFLTEEWQEVKEILKERPLNT
ncbi:MAG: hypothetical protein GXO18_00955 [Aquificae bacterium]|nr:hypothetical protein [Aquificota bacterium]